MKKILRESAAALLLIVIACLIAVSCAGCATTDPETTGKIDSWLRTICRWCL